MPAASDLIRKTVNNVLDFISQSEKIPMVLPAERHLSGMFKVSRTTLVQAFNDLEEKELVRQENHSRLVLRRPDKSDYYNISDTPATKTQLVENFILEKFAHNELKPGDKFSELQIAKEIGANTVTVREVLLKIGSTGLIKKKPRQKWEVISISANTVNEITEYREILEIHGLKHLIYSSNFDVLKKYYEELLERHEILQKSKKINREKLVKLENDFHKGIISNTKNRFILDNYESLFFVIRFHLGQHNMTEARFRNVLTEHNEVLQAIIERDFEKSVKCLKNHFLESKRFFFLANNLPFFEVPEKIGI
jgi:DNA-binding GntR family transcriptional regulator